MIPPHVFFADANRFDLDTLAKLYNTNKEWVSYCNIIKEDIIQRTFEPYEIIHGIKIHSSNTLFRLIPLKYYLQKILALKEGRKHQPFSKKIPNLFISKYNIMTMEQVYKSMLLLINIQSYITNDIDIPKESLYPYQLLNLVFMYQAIEKICIDYCFKELLENEKFIKVITDKCSILLEEMNNISKTMNYDTVFIYYHCVRYIRRVKRMLYILKKRH